MKTTDITSLPDYGALRQIRNALWKMGPIHGAAVMVGSGFSRFANRAADTVPPAPLWSDFVDDMCAELYPANPEDAPQYPLALAQEYQAALGPKALENLIRNRVRDNEWSPGTIHHQLLQLPWKDVLTTNWDTLLERAVELNPDISYDVVHTTMDIARTSAPRIVKLHGSLPSQTPFIFTEEDFRTYPTVFSAFVNLARQILLENELCLVGFSGNDPNFLEWSGWVRDQLGTAARAIRLVGVLDLSISRRRYFENRNVTAIDLAPLVCDLAPVDRHRKAIELFVGFLAEGRPQPATWKIFGEKETDDSSGETSRALALGNTWNKERGAHPGWLITPGEYRLSVRSSLLDNIKTLSDAIQKTSLSEKISTLIEAAWRCQIAFTPLPDIVEKAMYDVVAANHDRSSAEDDRILLRKALVREARRRQDTPAFKERISFLESLDGQHAVAESSYERCLMGRDVLDYQSIVTHVEKLQGDDPVWKLRRAALLSELGDSEKPIKLIYEALRELRERRAQSRDSIWILSREAWATWLLAGVRYELSKLGMDHQPEYPLRYKEARSVPWDELNRLDHEIARARKDWDKASQARLPSFDPGSYVVPGQKFFGSAATFPDNEITWLSEVVGIPLHLGHTDLLSSRFAEAALCSYQEEKWRLWALIRSVANGQLQLVNDEFSRTSVARMLMEFVTQLIDQIRVTIEFLLDRVEVGENDGLALTNVNRIARVSDLIEVLSYLSSRCNSDGALELVGFGAALAHRHDVVAPNIMSSLSLLVSRSLNAVEPGRRKEACLTLLKLPLACEKNFGIKERVDWAAAFTNIGLQAWRDAIRTAEWAGIIARLLSAIRENRCQVSREDAIHRLYDLSLADVLTGEENHEYGEAVWGHLEDDGTPSSSYLYPHIFRRLPGAKSHNYEDVFYKTVVRELMQGKFTQKSLAGLHGASFNSEGEYEPYKLNAADADQILENALEWKPRPRVQSLFSRQDWEDRETAVLIGRSAASTVLPSSTVFAEGGETANRMLERIKEVSRPDLVLLAPVLAGRNSNLQTEAMRVVREGLISQDPHTITMSLNAVLWYEKVNCDVPKELINDTMSICLMRREPGLLGALICTKRFVAAGTVSEEDKNRLVAALERLWAETNYENWSDEARGSDVGPLRREVVQLCKALEDIGMSEVFLEMCVREASKDPMPEVRYAASWAHLEN